MSATLATGMMTVCFHSLSKRSFIFTEDVFADTKFHGNKRAYRSGDETSGCINSDYMKICLLSILM